MEPGDAELKRAEDKRIIRHHGRYMRVYPGWLERNQEPEYVTVVTLPGN
jgi:hypothetical protein